MNKIGKDRHSCLSFQPYRLPGGTGDINDRQFRMSADFGVRLPHGLKIPATSLSEEFDRISKGRGLVLD